MDDLAALEEACKDVASTQEDLLKSIVEHNACCVYLQRHQAVDAHSFKANVPVVDYQDISEEVQQITDGDSSPILSKDPIKFFASSSGTTSGGKFKMIPQTHKSILDFIKNATASAANKMRFFEEARTGLVFMHGGELLETKEGIKIGWMSTLVIRNKPSINNKHMFTSPQEVLLAPTQESVYCHWLCALLQQQQVHFIRTPFANRLIDAVTFLKQEWRNLEHDIRTGTLNRERVRDEDARAAVSKILRADVGLADFVAEVCDKNDSWSGILQQLFPAAKYVTTIVTGSMKPYVPALKHYAGGLPLVGGDYVASEGYFGINLDITRQVEDVSYVLVPTDKFLEFIPYPRTDSSSNFTLVGMADLKLGESYEIVVTNSGGLYRYRVGDVVKVVGFFHTSPCIMFGHRSKATLTISWDKTEEDELQEVVIKAFGECGIELVDFSSTTDFSVLPGRYVIYCELKNSEDYHRHELLQKCSGSLDTGFNQCYKNERGRGVIGPLLLSIVEQGTFKRLMELAVENGASPMQYKAPRCVNGPEMLQVMRAGQAAGYSSSEKLEVK